MEEPLVWAPHGPVTSALARRAASDLPLGRTPLQRPRTRGVGVLCTINQGAQSSLASTRGRPRPSVARVSTAKQEGTLLRFHQGSSRSNACAPFSDQNLRNNGPLPNSEGCQQRLLPIKTSAPEGRVRPRVDASNDCSPWFMVQVHLTSRILRRCKGVLPRMRGGPWPLMGPRKPPKRRRRRPGAPRRADRARWGAKNGGSIYGHPALERDEP